MVHPVEERLIEPVQPRLALEPQAQAAGADLVTERQTPIAIHAEQRVAEDHVWMRIALAEPLDLIDDAPNRPRPVLRQDAVWTVRAELGAATAGQDRESAVQGTCGQRNGAVAATARGEEEVPPGKGQAVQIADLAAGALA